MPRDFRHRLDRLGGSLRPVPAVRFLSQDEHPDGRRLPTDAELEVEAARLRADGATVRVVRTVYTPHSIEAGHGPAEWIASA